MLATDTLAHKITYSPSGTMMITTACHPVPNGPNTNDSTIIPKTTMQSGIQRNSMITATINPEMIKVIRTSHDTIQQQIEAIQTTLQTMIMVLNRNILPPQMTELPSADPSISEISPTPDRTTIDTPKLLLLFDLANSRQSPHTEIDTPALPLKHSEPNIKIIICLYHYYQQEGLVTTGSLSIRLIREPLCYPLKFAYCLLLFPQFYGTTIFPCTKLQIQTSFENNLRTTSIISTSTVQTAPCSYVHSTDP